MAEKLNVTIIGAGSIGLLAAAKLTLNGHVISVVCRRKHQADRINKGIIYINGNKSQQVDVHGTSELSPRQTDLLIVAVKSIHVPSVVSMIQNVYQGSNSPDVLFIQNGMGHLPSIDLLAHNVLVGVVEHGARKINDHTVEHTGGGVIRISAYAGVPNRETALSSEDFPICYEHDWYRMLAKKLVINCAINPLSTLYNVLNGELLRNPRFSSLMREIVKETCEVLQLEFERSWNEVQLVCKRTSANTSSMLADVKAGRVTEIDAITGYILKEAEARGKYVPYSRFVYDSVKGLEMVTR
ncbi:2-dehydropantoate 2-reductase [Bacillus sp. RAR_GA_16]|nr:2-dehydropantoate 2-reductase [Bacillus sp. RAR_GA_16]